MSMQSTNGKHSTGHLRIGIDAGSKTVKAVAIDENGTIVNSMYHRHKFDVRETIASVIRTMSLTGNIEYAHVAFTGSAAIDLASQLGIPFVQEVIATTNAIHRLTPDADVVIELGGEDAKIVYLTGDEGVEQRMNATCAGGTGSFAETAAHMIGLHTEEASKLALGAQHIYPIASRCAVFAQNDIRQLLNAGATKADIAASALEAMAHQVVGGLACGRPIRGNVVLLGGVIAFSPGARLAFTHVLKDMDAHIIIPSQPHLATALGCALEAGGEAPVDLAELEWRLKRGVELKDDLKRLPPLFDSELDRAAFEKRHVGTHVKRGSFVDADGEVFIGLDAGSTTVKCAVVDKAGNLLMSEYEGAEGETLELAREMMSKALRILQAGEPGQARLRVGRALVTGYGEDLLRCAFGFDAGVVETAAHLRAALELRPDTSFVLDIGGQDMKALWVRDGMVVDAVLNEACSSGCGAFVGNSARSLEMTQESFNKAALSAQNPIDLGTKCTVFMTSRVRHAQKIGARREDIAAGIAYSVVNNALTRIIGKERAASMGDVAVVQGGAFKSDAVLRAFEKVTGCTVIRPDIAHLMGAYGAALLARDEWERMQKQDRDDIVGSSLISLEEMEHLDFERRRVRCAGCGNSCMVTIMDFGEGRRFASGNKCDRAFALPSALTAEERKLIPNTAQTERELLAAYETVEPSGSRKSKTIGLTCALDSYENTPFWHTLMTQLGFSVRMPDDARYESYKALAAETVPSESVCGPAKIIHQRYLGLVADGCDAVLVPRYERGRHCAVCSTYASALQDNVRSERLVIAALPCKSLLGLIEEPLARQALYETMQRLSVGVEPLGRQEFDDALVAAFGEQAAFEARMRKATNKAFAWLAEDSNRRAAALSCRPYHIDGALMHGIDEMLRDLGFAVIAPLGIDSSLAPDITGRWDVARNLRKTLAFADANPQVESVAIRSFGCVYDAVAFADVRREHPFTELKIDDMADASHIRIRLRTLAEVRGVHQAEGEAHRQAGDSQIPLTVPDACSTLRELLSRAHAETPIPETCVKCLACYAEREAEAMGVPVISQSELKEIAESKRNPLRRLLLLARRMTNAKNAPSIKGNRTVQMLSPTNESPRVGLVGNPLLVFDAEMNEDLVNLLASLGCSVVMPERDLLYVDDVRYLEQLDRFHRNGVDLVIYLQSFGCLKGHVQSRGAAHELARRYPDMPITIVDYDPDSSALNRENRIRLAVEASRKRKAEGSNAASMVSRKIVGGSDSPAKDDFLGVGLDETVSFANARDRGKGSGGKLYYDTMHRRIVSFIPLEELSGENRALAYHLVNDKGYSFELDSSPRLKAKSRSSSLRCE